MDKCNIMLLPTEILIKILSNMHYRDIINYGATCKRANKIVATYDDIFKHSLKNTIPDMESAIEKYELKYDAELKNFITLKKKVETEISELSSQTWIKPKSMDNLDNIYSLAMQNNTSYYYVILHLQNIIKRGQEFIATSFEKEQFTMTHMHYAKFYLSRLMHPYLLIKWSHLHKQSLLNPIVVANYFVQWIDPSRIYRDSDVDRIIEGIAEETRAVLENVKVKSNDYVLKTEVKLQIISYVLNNKNLYVLPLSSQHSELRSLSIIDVFENGVVSYPTLVAIYQAVAKRLDIHCELVVFENHLFLQWQNDESKTLDKYVIEINNGTLKPKGGCPYRRNPNRQTTIIYDPMNYVRSMYQTLNPEGISDWYKRNAKLLLRDVQINMETCEHKKCAVPIIDLKYITEPYANLLKLLTQYSHIAPEVTDIKVRKSNSRVMFGVGMVCKNVAVPYTCVIVGWSESLTQRLRGYNVEPLYEIITLDRSMRTLTASKLVPAPAPTRLAQIEEALAKDFTHFDGFAYVPNEQKKAEYPNEESIINMYRTHLRPFSSS